MLGKIPRKDISVNTQEEMQKHVFTCNYSLQLFTNMKHECYLDIMHI